MTKQEKIDLAADVAQKMQEKRSFYIIDIGGFNSEKTTKFRRKCHESNLELQMVKNKLIIKALDQLEGDYSEIYPYLKKESSILFSNGEDKTMARVVSSFRAEGDKPILKAAYVQDTVFLGDKSLQELLTLKTKNELIGDVIGLLQSPAKNVISALQSGGTKIHGLLETLSQKPE